MTGRRARIVSAVLPLLALGALAVSLGLHPVLAMEIGLTLAVVALAVALLRAAPLPARPQRERGEPAPRGRRADARRTVTAVLRSGWGIDMDLRPVVRDIVAARLALAGVSPDDPDATRAALPAEVLAVLAPGRRRREEPGMTVAELRTLFDRLEEL